MKKENEIKKKDENKVFWAFINTFISIIITITTLIFGSMIEQPIIFTIFMIVYLNGMIWLQYYERYYERKKVKH